MAFQAQVREWVDSALHVVLDPLFERLDKIEAYIKAFEEADDVPADPAPRGQGPEAAGGKAEPAAAKQAPSGTARTSRPQGAKGSPAGK